MAKIEWNDTATPEFQHGVDRGVVYVDGHHGVPWNGLTSVTLTPDGGTPRSFYLDGVKYLVVNSAEGFGGTIESFYSPVEFDECDGAAFPENGPVSIYQQHRKAFGFTFRSKTESGYKVHLIYDAKAAPTSRTHRSMSDSPDVDTLAWGFTTLPIVFEGFARTSHIVLETPDINPDLLDTLEDILYGTSTTHPRMPYPREIMGESLDLGYAPSQTGMAYTRLTWAGLR